MNSDAPSRLATALLRCLGPGEEALAGDLLEGYRSGRSPSWYWWQTAAAIALTAWRDLQHRTLAGLGAIALAVTVYLALTFSGAEIANDVTRIVGPHLPRWMFYYSVYQTCVGMLWMFIASWAAGVLTMSLIQNHGTTALIALLFLVTLVEYPRWTLAQVLSGPNGPDVSIILFQSVAAVVKCAGLVAGSLAFPTRSEGPIQRASATRRAADR